MPRDHSRSKKSATSTSEQELPPLTDDAIEVRERLLRDLFEKLNYSFKERFGSREWFASVLGDISTLANPELLPEAKARALEHEAETFLDQISKSVQEKSDAGRQEYIQDPMNIVKVATLGWTALEKFLPLLSERLKGKMPVEDVFNEQMRKLNRRDLERRVLFEQELRRK